MYPSQYETDVPPFAPETKFLIDDVEELVNTNIGKYLGDSPFRIKAEGYTPEMQQTRGASLLPIGINRLEKNLIAPNVEGEREFAGIDFLFTFPLKKSELNENPLNVTLRWTDATNITLALVGDMNIALVTHGEEADHVIHSAELAPYVMKNYLETIGLPQSFWRDDFKDLMGDIYFSRDMNIKRHSKFLLDIATTMTVSHDARYMTNDAGDKELVQELCLDIDHTGTDRTENGVTFPGDVYRNMFRFERSEDSDTWEYRGTYAGKLAAGEFVDELVQDQPQLGIPGVKLLEKAFNFLSEKDI
jgi:hypothetical protein